jgi:drug/metabolite transporter (DMT)-like permease
VTLGIFAVVLAAALLHAIWNALVKAAADKLFGAILITSGAAAIAAALLPFLKAPHAASVPFALASAVLQVSYYLLLARAYELSDMSQAYPVMRGTAPLLVAAFTALWVKEPLSAIAWAGIVAICCGILAIALGTGFRIWAGLHFALLNAFIIAAYTVVDGIGVRRSGAPGAYTMLVFLFTGAPLMLWAMVVKRSAFLSNLRRHWRLSLVGGLGTTVSYGLALWAMTKAPVAVVAALRETSIVFGTLIAWLVLKERIGRRRIIAAFVVAGGAVIIRLA